VLLACSKDDVACAWRCASNEEDKDDDDDDELKGWTGIAGGPEA